MLVEEIRMNRPVRRELLQAFFLSTVLCVSALPLTLRLAHADSPYSIALTEFRWTSFPLKVYVEMNQYSISDYAQSVREALDNWAKSIWNYSQTHDASSLPLLTYVLYLSNINATTTYGVHITFVPDTIPPGTNVVGLTNYEWNASTSEPVPPINITVTTFSHNATNLYVKNVVMHEFGHALGLGHASQVNTSDGPELMYYGSSKTQPIYPSTLDIYGLTRLYAGDYDHIIQLPQDIPYIMLSEGIIPTGQTNSQGNQNQYLLILIAASAATIAGITLILFRKKKNHEETTNQPELPPP